MAKKIAAIVRLQVPPDRHDAGPAAAHALGRRGVNLAAFHRAFKTLTSDDARTAVPLVVTIYEDRSFALVIDTPSGDSIPEPAVVV